MYSTSCVGRKKSSLRNPWLAATLELHPDTDEHSIFYLPAGKPLAGLFFQVLEGLGVSRGDRYEQMVKKLQQVLCTSNEAVGQVGPLWKVSLVPDAVKTDEFALVVLANHSLLDGHGFYRFYNMLSTRKPVESLSVERDQSVPARIRERTGGEPSEMDPSIGFVLRFVWHSLLNALSPRNKSMGFYLSESCLSVEKKRAASDGDVAYVSTTTSIHGCAAHPSGPIPL